MAFTHLTFRESLRDIETCLRALEHKLYHAGFRGKVSRSTLADANRAHDWQIFADFAQVLDRSSAEALRRRTLRRGVGADGLRPRQYHDRPLLSACFPWARFRRRKESSEATQLIDLPVATSPHSCGFTHGKTRDVTVLDHLPIEPGVLRNGSRDMSISNIFIGS